MRFKVGLLLAAALLASTAQANGAMGLGLEMWDLRYWFAYVVVIIGLEAWLIGRWHNLSWTKSVLLSLGVNALTGSLCSVLNPLAPLFHYSFVGSLENPNPFMNAVVLLMVFALPSAWLESIVWRWAKKPNDVWQFVKRVMIVHLVTVPIGLAILLIPERPYLGLEAMTDYNRRMNARRVERALQDYVMVNGSLPNSSDLRGIVRELEEYVRDYNEQELMLTFYRPEFTRFSTGEKWEHPFDINPDLVGKRVEGEYEEITEEEEQWVWYIRRPDQGTGYGWGIVVDLNTWMVKTEYKAVTLYGK